ncbi:MAG: transaldolase family protein [Candidatus Limnocylindria bacterium]
MARPRAPRRTRRRSFDRYLGRQLLRLARRHRETDKRLDALAAPATLKARLAIANAKLAYQHYKDAFSSERWEALATAGACKQRPLWASTSVKDPLYRYTRYVEELIGPETISTMPEETIRAFQDHGHVEPTLERNVDVARALLTRARSSRCRLRRRRLLARSRRRREVRAVVRRALAARGGEVSGYVALRSPGH